MLTEREKGDDTCSGCRFQENSYEESFEQEPPEATDE